MYHTFCCLSTHKFISYFFGGASRSLVDRTLDLRLEGCRFEPGLEIPNGTVFISFDPHNIIVFHNINKKHRVLLCPLLISLFCISSPISMHVKNHLKGTFPRCKKDLQTWIKDESASTILNQTIDVTVVIA